MHGVPMVISRANRFLRSVSSCLAMSTVIISACFSDMPLPACITLADCPAGQGYTGCLDGWCFGSEACEDRPAVSGDGCCALVEGDRTQDIDCLLRDVPLSCTDPAGPSIDDDGNIFVSCLLTSGDGVRSVAVRRYDVDGRLSVPLVVGPGTATTAPVIGSGDTVFVSSAGTVERFHTGNLTSVIRFDIAGSVGPMASNRGADTPRKVLAWPGSDGRVWIWDEDRAVLFVYGEPRPELGAGGAMQPTVSWTGRRLYVTWLVGVLDVLEIGSNPLGPVLSMQLPALPAGSAVDVDGRIYVPLLDGRLVRYRETTAVRLEEVWSVQASTPGDRVFLLVDNDNSLIVCGVSGKVTVVRDMDTLGSISGGGTFDSALDDISPVLTGDGRIVAVSEGGVIMSLLPPRDGGSILEPGLRFEVPSRPDSGIVLHNGVFSYVSESGSLVSWSFPDSNMTGRYGGGAAGRGSTGRTSDPPSRQDFR